jgi:DNA (cytosine-5)-methyltransferase 1
VPAKVIEQSESRLTSIELCAGGGGQAIGIERAGFNHLALVEVDEHCCRTLRANRPQWADLVHQVDLKEFDARPFIGVDLLAAGLPCPPFSVAGKQLGENDERNLFPDALRIIAECGPKAVMIENVRGILDDTFREFRASFKRQLERLGYTGDFRLFNASDFGVPQLRPRVVFVALKNELWPHFEWPEGRRKAPSVGEVLYPLMAQHGWSGAKKWKEQATTIAPTIVGGSKKHGGPDLGPTRARKAWATLGVNGIRIGDDAPTRDFVGLPYLTVPMVALLQGFPEDWQFSGRKTNAYRQVGNAFPPPVAEACAKSVASVLSDTTPSREQQREVVA